MSQADLALARDFIERIWNRQDAAAFAELFDPALIDHAYTPPDLDGHRRMCALFNAAFSDARHEIEHMAASDGLVLLRLRVSAVHTGPFRGVAPTGRQVAVQQYRSLRIRNVRIVEHWALFDTSALLQQIGALPDPALACAR